MRKEIAAIVSIASIVCVLSSFAARAQAPTTSTQAKVLHLTASHIVIDQPGMYELDRNWVISGPGVFTQDGIRSIEITANDVVLDLRGFSIDMTHEDAGGIYIAGANVTVRNGRVTPGIGTDGASTVIDAIEATGISADGPDAIVRNSSAKGGSARGERYLIERNRFDCLTTCFSITGSHGVFRDNRLYRGGSQFGSGGVLFVGGVANAVENNYIESVELNPAAIFLRGSQNVIARNTMVMTQGFGGGAAIQVQGGTVLGGTANVIDGNIANHSTPNVHWEFGIVFVLGANGNFYGNNRMEADQPFFTGSGLQEIDWGGNVGY